MHMWITLLLVLVWPGSSESSAVSETSKTSALIQTGHVVPLHAKFVDGGQLEGSEESESFLLSEAGASPDDEVEQCSLADKDCAMTFEDKLAPDVSGKEEPCESRFSVDAFLDVPALVVAFLTVLLLSVRFRSTKLGDKAADEPPPASASDERDLDVDEFGCTALHRAADEGSAKEVERLLGRGLDIEAREAWEETPLHIAARKGYADCVTCLLAAGANSEAVDLDDRTPLVLAAEAKHEDVCRILLDCGAGVAGMSDEDLPPTLNQLFLERLLMPAKEM